MTVAHSATQPEWIPDNLRFAPASGMTVERLAAYFGHQHAGHRSEGDVEPMRGK